MAERLEFDPPPPSPTSAGERKLEFDPPAAVPAEDPRETRIQAIKRAIEESQRGQSTAYPAAKVVADDLTLGAGRPLAATLGAATEGITGAHPGSSFGERYAAHIRNQNERAAAAKAELGAAGPAVSAVSSLPANYLTGGGGTITTLPRMALQSMVPGFIEGASKNAETLSGAAKSGTKDALLSAAGTTVLGAAAKSLNPAEWRAAAAEARAARGLTPDQVKAGASALYKQLDESGIAFDDKQTAPLYANLLKMRDKLEYSPNAHSTLTDYYDQLINLSRRGDVTFNQLHDVRSQLATQARGPDASTRAAAGKMIGEIDRLIGSGAPAINPNNVDIAQIYPEASRLWKAGSLLDETQYVAGKTARKEAWKSNVNPDESTRGNFARVNERLEKPGAYDPYTDEQRSLLTRIIEGGRGQNMKRRAGDFLRENANNLAFGATGVGNIAGIGGMLAGGGPAALGAGAVGIPVKLAASGGGRALQNSAAKTGEENVNALLRNISGSPTPVPGAAIDREDLAKMLFARDLARLSGQQFSSGESR